MPATIGDWYRLSDPELDDDRLTKRRLSAEKLTSRLTGANAIPLEIVSLAVETFGSPGITSNAALPVAIQAIEEQQPTADKDALSLALDPRILSAFAVDQALGGSLGTRQSRQGSIALLAGAVTAALRYRAPPTGAFAATRMRGLLESAEQVLNTFDARRRERKGSPSNHFAEAAADQTADWRKVVGEALRELEEDASKDREELEALWWVFGEYSYKLMKSYADLNPASASVTAGVELAEIVNPPATLGMTALASRMMRIVPAGSEEKPLATLLEEISEEAWALVTPAAGDKDVVQRHPVVFPISLVATRREQAGGIPDFNSLITGWSPDANSSGSKLAAQVFAERSLLRAAARPKSGR